MSKIRRQPVVTGFRRLTGGETVQPHWHDHHHLVYASTGVLSVSTADGVWVVPADRAVWIPAGITHAHLAYGTSTLLTVAVPIPTATGQPTELASELPDAPDRTATRALTVSALLRTPPRPRPHW